MNDNCLINNRKSIIKISKKKLIIIYYKERPAQVLIYLVLCYISKNI